MSLKHIPFVGACGCIFEKKKNVSMLWVCKVFVVGFTWPPRLPCLGRVGWTFGSRSVCVMLAIFLFCTPHGWNFSDSFFNSQLPFLLCSARARCEPRDLREETALMDWWMELGGVVVQHRRGASTAVRM